LFWAPQRDQIISKALKSNDLGAFIFNQNIKNLHKFNKHYKSCCFDGLHQ